MSAFRFLAWLLVAIALALLGADTISSLEAGVPQIRSTGMILKLFHIDGAALAAAAPESIAQAVLTLLDLPLWAIIGALGVVLTLVFRPME